MELYLNTLFKDITIPSKDNISDQLKELFLQSLLTEDEHNKIELMIDFVGSYMQSNLQINHAVALLQSVDTDTFHRTGADELVHSLWLWGLQVRSAI